MENSAKPVLEAEGIGGKLRGPRRAVVLRRCVLGSSCPGSCWGPRWGFSDTISSGPAVGGRGTEGSEEAEQVGDAPSPGWGPCGEVGSTGSPELVCG